MPSAPRRADAREVVAAGAVVLGRHRRVLLVHRPKYDDWSFPKGKLDPAEHSLSAAVREVAEETGLQVRLGIRLPDQRYRVEAGTKSVHYWLGRVTGDPDVSRYQPNAEIDAVRWVESARAASLLSYRRDRDILDRARELPRKVRTVVVLRHGNARSRRTWRGRSDPSRPLLVAGRRQAQALVPLLSAFGVRRVLSSSSARCVETVEPYAELVRRPVERCEQLSEEGAAPGAVEVLMREVLDDLLEAPSSRGGLVICSHRPVLPRICAALGVDDPRLDRGEMLVVHLSHGRPIACERHRAG